jgi:phosphoribosyl 1,2-cyclic phosphodiesterase
LRFASLGSGSRGNATLIEAGDQRLLLDCGFPLKVLEQRLDQLGAPLDTLTGLLLTHEHGDHVRGLSALLRRHPIPVYASHGTWRGCGGAQHGDLHLFHPDLAFDCGDLKVLPHTVPHDAREPCQYRFQYRSKDVAVLTDFGHVTAHLVEMLKDLDALVLECNHDEEMLAKGPYPWHLRQRVGGRHGHLSNRQAAELLERVGIDRLQHLIGAHLSEQNNQPDQARQTLLNRLPELDGRLGFWEQAKVSLWNEVN